ncbi:MAG TPA: helix-turn-helix transcriptional regulator [Ktedonobacterales bacterium]|jgi:DNA-binding transcriptional regulator YiaG
MPTLRDLREAALLSQQELAAMLQVSRQTVSDWEHAHARPRPVYRRKLVEIYKKEPEEIIAAIKATAEEEKERAAA